MSKTMTYCEKCSLNLDDEAFDYRFEYPICFECVQKHNVKPELDDLIKMEEENNAND